MVFWIDQGNFRVPWHSVKYDFMKEFSFLVRVPLSYSADQARAVNPRWDALLRKWKENNAYIISFAFPGEGYVISGADRLIKKEIVLSDNLKVVSNLFIRASSLEEALELAKDCPVLDYGGTVEVREVPERRSTPAD